MFELLDRKTGELRAEVARLDDQLRDLKSTNGIVSLEDTKKAHLDQSSGLQKELYVEEARLAEILAAYPQITNQPVSTNVIASSKMPAATNSAAPLVGLPVPVPPSVSETNLYAYRSLVGQLEYLTKQEQELLTAFTSENPRVRSIQNRIAEVREEKARLEKQEPGLVKEEPLSTPTGPSSLELPLKIDYRVEAMRVAGIQAKIQTIRSQLEGVRTNAAAVQVVENNIRDLTRRKDAVEDQFKIYSKRLEEARLDQNIANSKLTSIRVIQAPTAAGKDFSKMYKRMGAAMGGGLAAGIGLAFLLEMFIDQSVRRPGDLQKKLRLPVFVTIPRLKRLRGNRALSNGSRKALSAPEENGASSLLPALQSISANSSAVQTYCDALRDRLIHYFQKNNMTHKPKLVAVTGCGEGVGVSTVAAGLAASLSETGDGNVLLVDTNVTEGAAHPFYRGKLACGLNDVLKEDSRSQAQVQDNLYVAAANESDGGLIKALPKRFSQLVPKLKASDYDYIIFDLPPVTQTSITSKLAGFMDMVLLVVESEKTGRSIVAEATDLLRDSRATVATVLNKTRRYVPRWVHRDFE
jgi:Mrp family chromosome partitioning ATPase/capsule polysaccharide export protein KpsE/RkpR